MTRMTLPESLEAVLTAEPDDLTVEYVTDDDTITSRWVINTDAKADWALCKIGAAERRMAEAAALRDQAIARANEMIAAAEQWYSDTTADEVRTVANFSAQLTEYANDRLAAPEFNGKRTLSLPSGKISFRMAQSVRLVGDASTFVAWAHEHGHDGFVRVKEEVARDELRKHLQKGSDDLLVPVLDTGEAVPGIEIVAEDKSTVSANPIDFGGIDE